MSDLAFESARSLAARVRNRQISSCELLEFFLARVAHHNPKLNSVITLDGERARRNASLADAALARGELWGPLHGVPMTIKDAFDVAGMRTTGGAKRWRDHVPESDAVAVQRLRAAGAIIFGRTNVPAFCADVQSYNSLFGTTNNPWDVTRTPGGSSGGAAAALAAGMTPIELGSDIGGSIRTPAHWCGVYGHKPSYGLIPQLGHVPPEPGSALETDVSVVGPLARCTDDLALLLHVLAGPPDHRAHAYRLQLPPPRATSLRGYRVATWPPEASAPIDAGVQACLDAALAALRRAGVRVEMRAPALDFVELQRVYRGLRDAALTAGLSAQVLDGLRALAAEGGEAMQAQQEYARNALMSQRDWLALCEQRAGFQRAFQALFEQVDVLLCPVTPVPAIPHDHSTPMLARSIAINEQRRPYGDLFAWIAPASVCGLPATVIPIGHSAGLPVGIQIIGPHLEDLTTLDFGGRLSDLYPGFVPPPGY
jgi:amidase